MQPEKAKRKGPMRTVAVKLPPDDLAELKRASKLRRDNSLSVTIRAAISAFLQGFRRAA
jgi:hypothetical protein